MLAPPACTVSQGVRAELQAAGKHKKKVWVPGMLCCPAHLEHRALQALFCHRITAPREDPCLLMAEGSFSRKCQAFIFCACSFSRGVGEQPQQLPVKRPSDQSFSRGLLCRIPNSTDGPKEPNLLREAGKATVRESFKFKLNKDLGSVLLGAALPWR